MATAIVCENQYITIVCPKIQQPKLSLNIQEVVYGRTNRDVCDENNKNDQIDCKSNAQKSLNTVKALCQGKPNCTIQANNYVFGDPCLKTSKYLNVTYLCGSVFN